jgi:hypothetical protein
MKQDCVRPLVHKKHTQELRQQEDTNRSARTKSGINPRSADLRRRGRNRASSEELDDIGIVHQCFLVQSPAVYRKMPSFDTASEVIT